MKDEDWERIINDYDLNHDGMINFDEFKEMMNSLHRNEQPNPFTDQQPTGFPVKNESSKIMI